METNRFEHALPERADTNNAQPAGALAREQRMHALDRANQTRTARATLKNDLATGRARIEDVLRHPPTFARTAKVSDLMLAVRGVGPTRTTRALTR